MWAGARAYAWQARLRTAERLIRLLAVFCILGWLVFWLKILNRIKPNPEAPQALAELEAAILDRKAPDPAGPFPFCRNTLTV
ncbi:MAG: hypothetical protein OXJ64_14195, partial [Boseongicola sp.]|nr:hypothetical protein [Boseongicola sp.]